MGVLTSIKLNHFEILEKRNWEHVYYAIDLHGSVIKPNYQVGNIPTEFYPYAKEVLQMLSKRTDVVMYMYTCSHPHEQEQYLELFEKNDIHFKWVNKNMDVVTDNSGYGYYEDKPYFNVLFEDKAGFDPNTEWEELYYFYKSLDSDINLRNQELFNIFKSECVKLGDILTLEVSITNLIYDCIYRKDYKLYKGDGFDITGEKLKEFDVVMLISNFSEPCFMAVLDIDESGILKLYRCNKQSIIECKEL